MKTTMHHVHQEVNIQDAHRAFERTRELMHHLHMDIARFRKARKLSQRDLADMIGVDQSTIQRAESLHSSAKISTYLKYAHALNLELKDLFSEDEGLSADELAVLELFRSLDHSQRRDLDVLFRLARSGIGSGGKLNSSSPDDSKSDTH